jgi:hypothetical protein
MSDKRFLGTLLLIILSLIFLAALKHQALMIKALDPEDTTCPTKLDEWPVRPATC